MLRIPKKIGFIGSDGLNKIVQLHRQIFPQIFKIFFERADLQFLQAPPQTIVHQLQLIWIDADTGLLISDVRKFLELQGC